MLLIFPGLRARCKRRVAKDSKGTNPLRARSVLRRLRSTRHPTARNALKYKPFFMSRALRPPNPQAQYVRGGPNTTDASHATQRTAFGRITLAPPKNGSSLVANIVLDTCSPLRYGGHVFGRTEVEVIPPRVGIADSRRAYALYRLAATVSPRPPGRSAGPSEPLPTTGRGSDTLDLATTLRLSAGDDLASQFRRVSSKEEPGKCLTSKPNRGRSGRKAGGSGLGGYEPPACSSGPSSSESPRTAFGGGGTIGRVRPIARPLSIVSFRTRGGRSCWQRRSG